MGESGTPTKLGDKRFTSFRIVYLIEQRQAMNVDFFLFIIRAVDYGSDIIHRYIHTVSAIEYSQLLQTRVDMLYIGCQCLMIYGF